MVVRAGMETTRTRFSHHIVNGTHMRFSNHPVDKTLFKQKVLKKLYSSSLLEVKTNETATKKSKAKQEEEELETNKKNDGAIGIAQIVPECKKIYTVSLPPSGDVVCAIGPNEQCESQDSSEELEGRHSAEKFQRKCKRKRKLKSSVHEDFNEKTQTEFQQSGVLKTDTLQTLILHSAKPEAEILTKNRRRKLKKKRHKEKLKAAGQVSKATAVELIYQPGEESNDEAIEMFGFNAT